MQKYTLIFQLKLPGYKEIDKTTKKERIVSCVPSWNDVLGLEHWGRDKLKQNIQAAFSSALRALGSDSSMTTTSASNTWSIVSGIAASCLKITQQLRELKRVNAKQEKAKKTAPTSKSLPVQKISPPCSDQRIMDYKGSKLLVKMDGKGGYSIVRTATLEDVRNFRPI